MILLESRERIKVINHSDESEIGKTWGIFTRSEQNLPNQDQTTLNFTAIIQKNTNFPRECACLHHSRYYSLSGQHEKLKLAVNFKSQFFTSSSVLNLLDLKNLAHFTDLQQFLNI